MRRKTGALLLLAACFVALIGLLVWVLAVQSGAGGGRKTAYEAAEKGKFDSGLSSSGLNSARGQDGLDAGSGDQESQNGGGQSGAPAELEDVEEDTCVSLIFAGDILLSNHVMNAYDKAGGIHGILDERLRDEIESADIFMANEEFPFSDRGVQAKDKEYTFRLPTSSVGIFNELGLDIVSLANNHTLDYGREALLDSCSALESAGIRYVGAGENLSRAKQLVTLEAKGMTIGFLAASRVIPEYGWNAGENTPGMLTTYDPAILTEEIGRARQSCDFLVVYVHWGIERNTNPEDYQRELAKKYIDAGADLVVGSHPHVLQGLEYYNGKPIVYSLGNFIFGSSIPRTALLNVRLEEGGPTLALIPATSAAGYTQTVTDEDEKREFGTYMTGLSFGVTVDGNGVCSPTP